MIQSCEEFLTGQLFMKVLVLGATGMLGSCIFRQLMDSSEYDVWGTTRSSQSLDFFPEAMHTNLISGIDILDHDALVRVLGRLKPDVVLNCIGIVKQSEQAEDPLIALPINALFPHRLVALCELVSARLIHISTDCVFSGESGQYTESDLSDATDLYGKSKYLGELSHASHAITLRTSIIGHGIHTGFGLIDWFLSQSEAISGYKKAVFSGLTTLELTRVIKEHVIPNSDLSGLYHVAVEPISKFDLLSLTAEIYRKDIEILPENNFIIDRSLRADSFNNATGYTPPTWPTLITDMYRDYVSFKGLKNV